MDLLSARPPSPPDPLRRLWGPVTIRVAWDLLRAGVEVRPGTLRAAREHALWRLPSGAGLADAEAIASTAVEEYLARCNGRYEPRPFDPDLAILPTPAWRQALMDGAEGEAEAVLRLHYADGVPMDEVERRTGLDGALLRAAREGVREMARSILEEDGVSVDGWEPTRLDRLIARIAAAAGDLCPGPGGLATEVGRAHADTCPRCSRALRLFRGGVLSPGDLFPPEDGACLPASTIDLVAVGVHPDARKHARALARAFGDAARPGGDHVWLVDASRVDVPALLVDAAQRGAPPASQLRVARATVPGRPAPRAIVGPGVESLLTTLAGVSWGETSGVDPLPEPLPPPPSAARWWVTAAVVGLFAVAAGVWALSDRPAPAEVSLDVRAEPGAVVFDTDDDAWVDVIALEGGGPKVVFHSESASDKGQLATGDGRYRLAHEASAFVVVASVHELDGVDKVLGVLPTGAEKPADVLVGRLRERYAGAAVGGVP